MANPLTRAITATGTTLKRFQMSFGTAWGNIWASGQGGGSGWGNGWSRRLGGTRFDYANNTNPSDNAIVQACILWICRTFPEAPLQILVRQPDDSEEPVNHHPLSDLLKRPNPYYSGILLWQSTLTDWLTTGNAYWLKVRSGAGRVVELWWAPSYMMSPRWPTDGSAFLSHYEYRPDGIKPVRVEVEDVVHFRYGMDPQNVRVGMSPMASLLREIFTDDEAANFTSSILHNLGVPGVVIAPDSGDAVVSTDDLERVKAEFMARFGGDRRGEPLVMSGPSKVTVLSFSPQQMDLRAIRSIPEERISAILGVPAAVVGLGTGLANTKVGATMAEMREQAFENCIIPMQRLLSEELNTQLLGDFADPNTATVAFDLSKVRVLQDDQDKLFARAVAALEGGLLTRNQALQMIGEESHPNGDVLYVPNNVTVTHEDELDVPPPPPPQLVTQVPPDGMAPGQKPPALPAPAAKPVPAKAFGEYARLYADSDLVAALQEHAAVLSETKAVDEWDGFLRVGPSRNGHAAVTSASHA